MKKQIHGYKFTYYYKKLFKISLLFWILIVFLTTTTFSYATSEPSNVQSQASVGTYPENNNDSISNSEGLDIYADSCILIDEKSGEVLYNKNGFEKMYPASTTKLITAILVLEHCNLDDMVNVSHYAVASVPATYSNINLIPSESFSVKDLLYSLLIGSANDAAFVLAEYIANGGNNYALDSSVDSKNKFNESIAKFSDMMNAKAAEIGCTNTHFVNPNGIQNENHYSTAHDLAIIGQYAYKNSTIMSIVDDMTFSLPNTQLYTSDARTCKSTNPLLYSGRKSFYEYANGMKTGYTDAAGYCIVASAKKDDFSLIAVVLNSKKSYSEIPDGETDTSREADCKTLFDYGFNNYSYQNLNTAGNIGTSVKIINADPQNNNLDLLVKDNISVLVKKDEVFDITPKILVYKMFAPVAKGEIVGTISYKFNGQTYTSNLIASRDVYSVSYMNFIIALFCIFIILLLIMIVYTKRNKKKS